LSNYAKVQKVLVDGELYFERDKDMSERVERAARKKALLDKDKEREKKLEEMKKNAPSRRPS
jgi:hypothetical protein